MPEVNSGDTAWLLVSTALVTLMTPGLALFYGGMVRGKNVLSTFMHGWHRDHQHVDRWPHVEGRPDFCCTGVPAAPTVSYADGRFAITSPVSVAQNITALASNPHAKAMTSGV